MKWLSEWLKQNPRLAMFAKCASPPYFRGKAVAELNDSDFKCAGKLFL